MKHGCQNPLITFKLSAALESLKLNCIVPSLAHICSFLTNLFLLKSKDTVLKPVTLTNQQTQSTGSGNASHGCLEVDFRFRTVPSAVAIANFPGIAQL